MQVHHLVVNLEDHPGYYYPFALSFSSFPHYRFLQYHNHFHCPYARLLADDHWPEHFSANSRHFSTIFLDHRLFHLHASERWQASGRCPLVGCHCCNFLHFLGHSLCLCSCPCWVFFFSLPESFSSHIWAGFPVFNSFLIWVSMSTLPVTITLCSFGSLFIIQTPLMLGGSFFTFVLQPWQWMEIFKTHVLYFRGCSEGSSATAAATTEAMGEGKRERGRGGDIC